MNKKIIYSLVGLALIFFITSLLIFLKSNSELPDGDETLRPPAQTGEEILQPDPITLKLFFYTRGSRYMKPVTHELVPPTIRAELYRLLIDLLLAGRENYITPVPKGVGLRTLYFVEKSGLLVLDFSEELVHTFPAGTSSELEFIYFMVNNLCYNFKEIKKVKFLVAGNSMKILTGHINMEHPFYPDFRYILDK